jgi:hypothetical protein
VIRYGRLSHLYLVEQVAKLIHYRANFRVQADDSLLFAMLPPARALLSRLSFCVQGFIGALSCYVYDIAIGRPFDRFMNTVKNLRSHVINSASNMLDTDIDVFSLGQIHSDVMDGILSGCLLRSTQHAASTALNDCMRVVLRVGRLITQVVLKEVPEIRAASELDDLQTDFEKCASRFVSSLRAILYSVG